MHLFPLDRQVVTTILLRSLQGIAILSDTFQTAALAKAHLQGQLLRIIRASYLLATQRMSLRVHNLLNMHIWPDHSHILSILVHQLFE